MMRSWLLVLVACQGTSEPPPKPIAPKPTAPNSSSDEGASPRSTRGANSIDAAPKLSFGDQLVREAAHRPKSELPVERVTAALGVTDVKQFLATTAKATYCAGGATGALAISVCEYDTPEAAAAGRAFVEKTFAAIVDRRIAIRGTTSLTIVGGDDATRAALEAKFNAL